MTISIFKLQQHGFVVFLKKQIVHSNIISIIFLFYKFQTVQINGHSAVTSAPPPQIKSAFVFQKIVMEHFVNDGI